MEENQVNRTALWAAYLRGYHSENVDPKIFDDNLAYRLFTQEERTAMEQFLHMQLQAVTPAGVTAFPDRATALEWMMQMSVSPPQVLSRARYVEDCLEEGVRQGIKQYVILGAGMDTFVFRRPDLVEKLQVFEVDLPATQAFKRRRVEQLGWEHPVQLHYVPMDFTKDSLAAALSQSSYDPQALTLFSWLGVTYYLPREVVFAMLRAMGDIAPAGSTVIFDYMDLDAFIPEKAVPRVQTLLRLVQQMGARMITGFDPLTFAEDLASVGFRLKEDLSPYNIQRRYFMGRTDHYRAPEHTHLACAVV